MGAVFSIPIYSVPDTETLLDWAKGHSLHTIATSARADIAYQEGDYQTPALLMLGSEGEGLPTRVLEVAHQSVSIPMAGSASSLNLSVAAGVLLFEIQRQVRS
jgi:23S rRNA (guanosine2251-2'-O)-methyltransferase